MPDQRLHERYLAGDDRLADMEFQLQANLSPVVPNPDFIRHLHSQLVNPTGLLLEPESRLFDLIIAFCVATGGIVLLVATLRGIFEVLVLLGLIRSTK